ncbi:MAG: GNAT family N-acetyltransferase [Albidovulum sp.]|uniref:GNAT family N-acetyltransferase n=1 Tax=Albidovulum sp. TaxID=1872424 RepID=UPI003CAC8065
MITITRDTPLLPELSLLMERHAEAMHADTPPESIHMMDAGALAGPEIAFFVMRDDGQPIGMGALKRIDAAHAEIKSMHILAEMRGRGLARTMLEHLIAEAKAEGYVRLSLETGAQPAFAAAHGLYAGSGFKECPAFAAYGPDPNSIFMTMVLE